MVFHTTMNANTVFYMLHFGNKNSERDMNADLVDFTQQFRLICDESHVLACQNGTNAGFDASKAHPGESR